MTPSNRSSRAHAAPKKTGVSRPRAAKQATTEVAGRSSAAPPPPGHAEPKDKLVRDSFTIPKAEYLVLQSLKERATRLRRPAKKSELLRAGISSLHGLSDAAFLAVLRGVPSLKPGRPKASMEKKVKSRA